MKKIMVVALAAAFITPLAMADVSIYGSIRTDVEYDHFGDKNGVGAPVTGETRIVDSSSRIGFKGTDKWDNGWATIWQVETGIGAASPKDANGTAPKGMGGGAWGNRNTFIGFTSQDFGTFRAGNYDNTYKNVLTASKQSALFDDFLDSMDPKITHGTFAQLSTRLNDNLAYESPVWSGFQLRGNIGLDGSPLATGSSPIYDIGGLYNYGGFNASLVYQYAKNRNFENVSGIAAADSTTANVVNGAKVQGYELAAGYAFSFGLGLGAGWEHINNDDPTNATLSASWNNYMLTANYWVSPKFELQGLYTRSDKVYGVDDLTGQQVTLAGVYYLSKQTRWYTSAVGIKNDGAASTDKRKNFGFRTNSGSLIANNGQTVYSVMTGLRTDF